MNEEDQDGTFVVNGVSYPNAEAGIEAVRKSYDSFREDDEDLNPEIEKVFEDLDKITHGVIEKILRDRIYMPTLDEAKVVMTYMALESATEGMNNASQNQCKLLTDFISSEIDLGVIKESLPDNDKMYWQKISRDHDEFSNSNASDCELELIASGFFERFDLETSDELGLFLAKNLSKYEVAVIQEFSESGMYTWAHSLLSDIHMTEEAQNEVAKLCLDYVHAVEEDQSKNEPFSSYEYYLDEFRLWGKRLLISPTTEVDMASPQFKVEMSLYVKDNGLPTVLNMLRHDLKDPEKAEKARSLLLYMMGDLANRSGSKQPVTDADINEFYDAIFLEPKEYLLNTAEAKQKKINFVANKLNEYGIVDGNITEFACGTGWLSGGLESHGFSVNAFDRHPTMIEIGAKDYPNVVFGKFDWNRWQEWKELKDTLVPDNSQEAVVVNGRSDRHMRYPFETLGQISSILKDGGIYLSDSPDVESEDTPQEKQLSMNRDFHEMLGFYRPWLEKYFWYTVGAPMGQEGEIEHFIESWVPSQELKILYAEANCLEHMETISEKNYDGRGSNDNYFVFRRVSRKKENEFKKEALQKVDKYFSDQPKDPEKPDWYSGERATYRD